MFNAKLKIVSTFLLLSLGFVFSHSELGQCEVKDNGITQHDYCEIVKGAVTQLNKLPSVDLLKLKFDDTICCQFLNYSLKQITLLSEFSFENSFSPEHSSELYLYNRIFLI